MSVEQNLKSLREEIKEGVTLLAVSKTKPIELLEEAYSAGVRDFGENKVQELVKKHEEFHKDVRWHLIGNLQTNKVKYIVGKVFLIHSLSGMKLLKKLELEYSKINENVNTLLQINIGREDTKGGILEEEIEDMIKGVEECEFVKVKGIMVIIPKGNEESNRYYFKKTNDIYNKLKEKKYKNISMEILSMGMTNDYKIAIEEGSNLVRIGAGIFGKRD